MSTRSHRTRTAESQPASTAAASSSSSASAAADPMRAQSTAAAAAPAKRSKSKAAAAAAAAPMEDDDAAESGADAAAASSSTATGASSASFSVSAFLSALGGAQSPAEESAAAAQLRTMQHAIMKQANTRAGDLMHPELWPAFLARMQALPANTVRIDVHLLGAISRTLAECIAHANNERADDADDADAFALLPTLQRLLQLLLPADNLTAGVSVAESWASTFHPNYELTSAFIGGLLRMVPAADAVAPAVQMTDLPPSVWRFLSTALAAFALINAQQTSQRKVYEHALQERNLPVWASVHQAIQTHVQRVRQEAHLQNRRLTAEQHARSEAMRECATKLEQCITGVLFHAEHLSLYADALGFKNTTAKEESDEEEEKKAAAAAEGEDAAAAAAASADEPAGKKAKTEPTDSKAASRKKSAATAAGAAHKPHPNNFTHKLFEAVQAWISRDQAAATPAAAHSAVASATAATADAKSAGKKRKTASAPSAAADDAPAASAAPSAAAPAVPVSSRAIRALLPLLFSGFVSSSESAHQALYPSESSSHELSALEARRKKVKEALKSERELKFLQRMWAINEGVTGAASDALVSPVFSAPLTSLTQLCTLHDMFTTSASLFRLIAQHGIYKINQDANAASGSFTGFKKHLANQMHAIMAVVRNLILAAQTASASKAGKKASTKTTSVLSKADLLSLAVPLSTNLHHLLSLNPEFLSRYLYVRSTKSSAPAASSAASASAAEVNVWHLVWKVVQLSTEAASSSSSLPSPPGLALPTVRQLSQSILASYSKSRSMETCFNSYLSAARSAAILDPSLPIQPFATMCGPAFDTSAVMRSVPVLKVPSLWEWFLAQADRELTSEAHESSPETQQALLHFFVYFLDTLLVREEIAVALQALIGKTMQAIIAQPLRTVLQQHLKSSAAATTVATTKAAKASKSKSKKADAAEESMSDVPASELTAASSKLPLSCLLLLLHSLNDLTAQCAQHLEKTYETMLQPLVGYFAAIDSASSASTDGSDSSASGSGEEMRLTEVISSLSSSSASDASLLYSLHLLAIQRLHQLFRFESRNITTHSGLFEPTADSDDEDADQGMDSDGDEKPARAKKTNGQSGSGSSKRAPQTHSQEAQALTAFLLEHQASCRYDASSSADALDRYSWDGSASSLSNDNAPRSATALWFLLAGNLDVVAHFASPLQRQALVQSVVAISAYTHCDAAAAASEQSQEGSAAGPAASASLHTLRSITSVLYTQPWFYEVSVLRPVLMDVALSNLMETAAAMFKAVDKAVRKAAAATASSSAALTIPAEFTLTTAVADQLPTLRQFAEYASNAAAATSSSSSVSAQSLWDSIWLLQLLHTFPAQYFASSAQFHALIVHITWSIESLASTLSPAAASKKPAGEPLSLMEIARAWQTVDASSLYSHLILASRRMLLSSLNALAISPAAASSALLVSLVTAPLLEWACFGTFRRGGGLLGRHVAFARETTRTALHLISPALLLAGKHKIKVASDDSASSEEKKTKSSAKADKGEKQAPISVLQPVIEKIVASLNAVSGSSTASDRSDALWCLQLSSSLVESFVPGWSAPLHGGSSAASIDALAKSFRTLSRDAPLVFDLLSQLNRAATKKLLPLLSASSDDLLLGGTFDLSARLLVNFFAYRMSITTKEKAAATPAATAAMDAKMDDKLLSKAEGILAAAVKLLTEQDGAAASTIARQGAITLVHALCVILPLFQADPKAPITFAALLDAVTRAMACDAGKRLQAPDASAASSAVTNSIIAAFASLQSHATPADSAQMVHACLAQLDPSFAHAAAMSDASSAPSMHARHSGALQLLYVYIYHMQTSAQRQAVSHAHVALLLYRLGALSADWSNEYLSRSAASASCVSLASSALTLLSHILSRHQVFILDDASLSLLAQVLNNVAVMLRDSVAKRSATDTAPATTAASNSFSLFTPFYLTLYSLLKFHPASTIKLVHLFLGSWVRAVLEAQWKKIQHSDPALEVVPLSISENAARLLEEVGKPSHAKLFNHYAVGVLLEWINLSKTKGVGWGSLAQDKHVKTIQRGIYAIINICEEHDLAQLHNLLDASGRTIFRALHQAYKKTKFTGLV